MWSFLISYGIGFGYPLILLNPEATKKCGRSDFLEALNSHQLNNGIDGLLERGAKISDVSIILDKFKLVLGNNLFCIRKDDNIESLKALNGIDSFLVAMNIRLEMERKKILGKPMA